MTATNVAGLGSTMSGPEIGELPIRRLFALNILVQLADGTLTYSGISLGFFEGNPLLRSSMSTLGVEAALLLYKAYACGLLLLVRRRCPAPYSSVVLTVIASAVSLLALVPWLGKHASFAAFAIAGS